MVSKRYDLHCHSSQSDGILSPEALVSRAKANQVDVLALTDHDTISGVRRARAQAEKEDLTLINGIEFSCQWAGCNIHIVGLAFDCDHPRLVQSIDEQEQARRTFKRYLGAGKVGDVKQHWPEIGDVVEMIVDAGGVAVLAHPMKYKITRTKLRRLIEDFCDAGGRAIEIISGAQKPHETADMLRLAERYELLSSCGSDFHAPGMKWAELGQMAAMPKQANPVWQFWESLTMRGWITPIIGLLKVKPPGRLRLF